MSAGSIGWKIAGLLGMVLTAAGPIYATYDVYGRGPVPEKRVQLQQLPPIDPLKDLSALGDKVALSLKMEDQIIDNIVVVRTVLSNLGDAPIIPSEFHENFSVTVFKPRKIIAVENSPRLLFRSPVQFRWKRVSDTKFEAAPALLNPGDRVSTSVYLTNT